MSLWTKWEEFQQHEESMGRLNDMKQQQQMRQVYMTQAQASPNGRWNVAPPQPQPPMQAYVTYDTSMAPSEAWYPADSNKRPGMVALSDSQPTYSYTLSPARHRPPMAMSPQPPPGYAVPHEYVVHQAATPNFGYSTMIPRGRDLARPPLHSQGQQSPKPPQSNSIKTRVMSALGMKTQSTLPAGLRNNGENICFVNSVLQCLAHCPGLTNGLGMNEESPECTPAQVALVTAVTELLQTLSTAPSNSPVTHADKVRQAASTLPGTMVAGPKQAQHQQDAAEFLMWLLDALHSALDVSGKGRPEEKNESKLISFPIVRISKLIE